jgi:hypothetical protein
VKNNVPQRRSSPDFDHFPMTRMPRFLPCRALNPSIHLALAAAIVVLAGVRPAAAQNPIPATPKPSANGQSSAKPPTVKFGPEAKPSGTGTDSAKPAASGTGIPQPAGASPPIDTPGTPPPVAAPGAPPVAVDPQLSADVLDSKLKKRFDDFFQRLKRGETAFGYAKLLEGSKIADQRDEIDKLIAKTDQAVRQYGKFEDAELASIVSATRTLKEVIYISRCEFHPLRWKFICYFGGGKWQLLDINVTGELDKMFPLEPDVPPEAPTVQEH